MSSSPIEAKFFDALMDVAAMWRREICVEREFYVPRHKNCGPYRIDFLIVDHSGDCAHSLAVECDGHSWHERTKEQARQDRLRERVILRAGYPVARFTGSELHKNANKCARQALSILGVWEYGPEGWQDHLNTFAIPSLVAA